MFVATVVLRFDLHSGCGSCRNISPEWHLERLGFVFEIDTTLSKDLEWGKDGIPWEFRAGVSLHF